MIDREPQPEDGPDYHADHAYWESHSGYEPEKDIYTARVDPADPTAMNTVLWRLSVALGWADRGQGEVYLDPTHLLEEVENALFRLKGLEK